VTARHPSTDNRQGAGRTTALTAALAAALALVAVVTLLPTGQGWAWGSPLTELRWYTSGLGSADTLVQLAGNLALLAVPAGLAVLRWPALGTPGRLLGAGLATGSSIELLQRLLPLGRVVSPLDALLNATGALVAGLLMARLTIGTTPRTLSREG
jgi:hypothetical protein